MLGSPADNTGDNTGDGAVRVDRPWWADPDDDIDEAVAMQARCVACGAEHYSAGVYAISAGYGRCGRCGHKPGPMSPQAYTQALSRWRAGP